jgi:hypothetical protein
VIIRPASRRARIRPASPARRARAADLLDRLHAQHPGARIELDYTTPLELLVATVLSAQTTDVRVNQVTPALFRRFRTPADYVAVPVEELAEAIRPTGFFRQKAASIRAACATILERFGGEVPATLGDPSPCAASAERRRRWCRRTGSGAATRSRSTRTCYASRGGSGLRGTPSR